MELKSIRHITLERNRRLSKLKTNESDTCNVSMLAGNDARPIKKGGEREESSRQERKTKS